MRHDAVNRGYVFTVWDSFIEISIPTVYITFQLPETGSDHPKVGPSSKPKQKKHKKNQLLMLN